MTMKSSNYHPLWYQRNRPYSKFAKQTIKEHGFTNTAIQSIQERITREWNSALDLNKVNKDEVSTDLMKEISLAFYYGGFACNGYNLFSFTDKLGEMLAHTKADEVPIDALKSPYPVYYIQFHKPILWGSLELSGAYIIDDERIPTLQVCIVVSPLDSQAHWMTSPAGYFYLPLSRETEMNLGDLIHHTIDSEIAGKWEHVTASIPIVDESIVSIVDVREQRAKRESMDLSSGRQAIQQAMEYIANCLCYLSSHDDFSLDFPADSPQSLIEKTTTAKTPKQAKKAQSQLKSMGFHPITYVGLQSQASEKEASDTGTGKHKKQHWRRGHWRNQKCGKGLSATVLKWIQPTLVGDGDSGEELREYKLT